MTPTAYLIPGRGEPLEAGLGRLLMNAGYAVHGRAIASDFAGLPFWEQLAWIRSDLLAAFWRPDALLVGRSYGAYLLLHTLADMEAFPGRVLLFSPVLGAAVARNGRSGSRPPLAEKLAAVTQSGQFPAPRHLEIHTGADDNGCDPALAERFASFVGNTELHVVEGAGHDLGEPYIEGVLSRLPATPSAEPPSFQGTDSPRLRAPREQ